MLFPFVAGDPAYDPDARAHFARMQSNDQTLKGDIDWLIRGLKTDGLWAKLDVLCVIHDNEADSLLNLKGPVFDATNVSRVWSASRGFDRDSSTADYVNSNFNYASSGVASSSSRSMFAYFSPMLSIQSEGAFSAFMGIKQIGTGSEFYIDHSQFNGNGSVYLRVDNENDVSPYSMPSIDYSSYEIMGVGFVMGNVLSGTETIRLDSNESSDAINQPLASLTTTDLHIGSVNIAGQGTGGSGPNAGAMAWGFGAGMNATQRSNLRSWIAGYMDRRGLRNPNEL